MRNKIFNILIGCFLIIIPTFGQHAFFEILSLNISTQSWSETNAVPYKNGIVYNSNKKTDILRSLQTPEEEPLFDIYYAVSKNGKDKFFNPKPLSPSLNSKLHEGPVCFSSDFSKIYFTRNISNNFRRNNMLGIFEADLADTVVSNITPMPFNGEDYNVAYPWITSDGQTMFFCSDMQSSIGKYDIFFSEKRNGEWGEPVNLGANINTRQNEVMPFYHEASKRLYFASRGHETLGRYDLFYCKMDKGKWLPPVNLGEPINTKRSDYQIYLDPEMQTGYLSSERDKSKDIFRLESTFPNFEECPEQKINKMCYTFFEKGSSDDFGGMAMDYEWDLGDGTKIRDLKAYHCFEKPGKYIIKLNVIDSLTGETYFSQAEYEFDLTLKKQPFITCADTVKVGQPIEFDGRNTNVAFEVDKYYWEFEKFELNQGINTSYTFRTPGTYQIKLGVSEKSRKENLKKQCGYKTVVVE